jgi:hypothetical protein
MLGAAGRNVVIVAQPTLGTAVVPRKDIDAGHRLQRISGIRPPFLPSLPRGCEPSFDGRLLPLKDVPAAMFRQL